MALFKRMGCLLADVKGLLTFTHSKVKVKKKEQSKENSPLRVVRCISRLNIGGPSIHASLLHHHLDSKAFKTFLVTGMISSEEGDMAYLFKSKDPSITFIPELRREIHLLRDAIAFVKLVRFFFQVKPDILHTHLSKAGAVARAACICYSFFSYRKVKMFHTFHGNIFNGYFGKVTTTIFRYLEIILARFTHRVIAISHTQKEEICNTYGITTPEKVTIIKLGFDLTPFLTCEEQKGTLRKRLSLSDDTILVGIIGRMVPIKNHHLFFETAKRVSERLQSIHMKFIIVGDGELRSELETFCSENNLSDHVYFLGWTKNISEILADLDILMMTSFNEGTPVSIIEAMAASVPVVSSDVGGVSDLLGNPLPKVSYPNNGFNVCERGILCPSLDVKGFVHALEYMMTTGYLDQKDVSTKMRSYVKHHYTQNRLLQDVEYLYKEVEIAESFSPGKSL